MEPVYCVIHREEAITLPFALSLFHDYNHPHSFSLYPIFISNSLPETNKHYLQETWHDLENMWANWASVLKVQN